MSVNTSAIGGGGPGATQMAENSHVHPSVHYQHASIPQATRDSHGSLKRSIHRLNQANANAGQNGSGMQTRMTHNRLIV